MDITLTNLNGYEGFEELAVLARETIDRNTKPLHIEIEQLRTELDKVTKIANSRVCDSCGQLHPFDCMCPPVEVRLKGNCWYHKTIKRLQDELDKYKTALTAISSAKDSFATVKSCVQVATEALKEG